MAAGNDERRDPREYNVYKAGSGRGRKGGGGQPNDKRAAKGGKRLVLSGFHDATGNAAMNAELAKQRAMSVRDALVGAGVAESSLELKKPEESTGSGNDAEARRVEVTIVE